VTRAFATPDRLFVATAAAGAAAVAWLYSQELPLRAGFELDAFHHMASVRELARGELPPRHNLVPGRLPQGHYGPYLVLLGWLARISGSSPILVLYVAGVVNVALYLGLFRLLVVRLAGPGPARWAGLAPLVLWGPWPAREMRWDWIGWPGTTALAEAYNFFYPNQAGLILLLVVLVLLCGPVAADRIRARAGGLTLLISALLVATHPLSAILMAASLLALGVSRLVSGRLGTGDAAWLLSIPVVGLLLASLWPYYPVPKLLPAFGIRWFASGGPPAGAPQGALASWPLAPPALPLFDIFGPASVGLLGLLALARRGRAFPLLWFLVCLLVLVVPLVPMRHRFAFFAALPLHVGSAWTLEAAWRHGWPARAAALGLLACGGLSAALRLDWVLERRPPSLELVARHTPEDAVVLTTPGLSNGIAGLTGRKVVCPQNPDLFLVMGDGVERMADQARFFRADTTAAERARILGRWDVSHVLIDRFVGFPGTPPGAFLAEQDGLALYDVRPAVGARREASEPDQAGPGSSRKRQTALAKRSSSPSSRGRSDTTSPFTRVRFVEPRSWTTQPVARCSSRAWAQDTRASPTGMSASGSRPTSMTGLESGKSTRDPSLRVKTRRAGRAPFSWRLRVEPRAGPPPGRRC
jgi:hypothetical protein